MKSSRALGGFRFTEGPLWVDEPTARSHSLSDHPGLFFSDIEADRQYFYCDGVVRVVREPSGRANGTALSPEGDILSCEHATRRVSRRRPAGSVETVIERFGSARLNSPNDLCVMPDGAVVFTDPPYGVEPGQREISFSGVYRLEPNGEVTVVDDRLIKPNGLAVHPDGEALVVADTATGGIYVYRPGGETPWVRELLTRSERPDGIAYDEKGALLIAALDGIAVFDEANGSMHTLQLSERPANLCFGGESRRDLYVCARTSVIQIEWPHPGLTLH